MPRRTARPWMEHAGARAMKRAAKSPMRFAISSAAVEGAVALVGGGELHHMRDVMRLVPGAEVALFDERGAEYAGTIKSFQVRHAVVEIAAATRSRAEVTAGLDPGRGGDQRAADGLPGREGRRTGRGGAMAGAVYARSRARGRRRAARAMAPAGDRGGQAEPGGASDRGHRAVDARRLDPAAQRGQALRGLERGRAGFGRGLARSPSSARCCSLRAGGRFHGRGTGVGARAPVSSPRDWVDGGCAARPRRWPRSVSRPARSTNLIVWNLSPLGERADRWLYKFAFVMDPLGEGAARQGHHLRLHAGDDRTRAPGLLRRAARPLRDRQSCVRGGAAMHGDARNAALSLSRRRRRVSRSKHFDAIFMRKDPPADAAYLYATMLLSLADRAPHFHAQRARGPARGEREALCAEFSRSDSAHAGDPGPRAAAKNSWPSRADR